MLNQIAPRETPVEIGPTTDLDRAIDEVLADGTAREPRAIHAALAPGYPLGQVHARLKVMVNRGLVQRIPTPGGPQRGRGAGTYRRA